MSRLRTGFHCSVALSIGFLAGPLPAGDFDDQPFEIRLWSAMSRSISSTDAIGRQASVAYPSGSSDNPAGSDVRDFELLNTRVYACAGTHHVLFSEGAWIAAGDVNGFLRLGGGGTLAFGYLRISTLEGRTRQGFNDVFRNNEYGIRYGRKVHAKGYIGVSIRFRDMDLEYDDTFQDLPRRTRNHSFGGSVSVGGMWRPNSKWTFGSVLDAGWIDSDVQGAVSLPGGGDLPFQLEITTRSVQVKTGLGWAIAPAVTCYVDGQYFHIGNRMYAIDLGRFYWGGDIRLSRMFSLMAGASLDTLAQASASTGIGISLSPGNKIKMTYQYNPLPDVDHEFGKGHIVSATVVVGF